jgi:hypothetical protein
MAEMATQLAVFMKNVPGTLHDMLRSLSEGGVNIEGIMVNDATDHAVVRLVVSHPSRAIHLLGERGAVVVESEVVALEMANEPGQMLALSGKLAQHKINISYIYGSTPREGGLPRIYLHSSDDEKVVELLGSEPGEEVEGKGGQKAVRTAASRGSAASELTGRAAAGRSAARKGKGGRHG